MKIFGVVLVVLLANLGIAQTIDCGRAPENITDITYAKSLWKKYLCTKDNVAVGATIPVADIPVGLNFSQQDSTCTQEDKDDLNIQYHLQQYLFTNESLRFAECGYRACELLAHGASDPAILGYYGVCGGVAGNMGQVGGNMSALRIERETLPVEVTPEDFGKPKQTFIQVQGSTDANFSYRFSSTHASLHPTEPTGTIYHGQENSLPLKVDVPEVKRGEPKYLGYYLTLGAGSSKRILTGYVLLTRALKPGTCTLWMNDKCMKCEIPVIWPGYAHPTTVPYACSEMPPKSRVRATFDGVPEIYQRTPNSHIDNDWINIALAPPNVGCAYQQTCYGTHGVPFPGPYTWTHFHIFNETKVADSGISDWQLRLEHCQSWQLPALCDVQPGALLTIESLDANSFTRADALLQEEIDARRKNFEDFKSAFAAEQVGMEQPASAKAAETPSAPKKD